MKDIISCFNENTIKISDSSSCSFSSSAHISHSTHQNTVSCLYQTILSPQKHFLIAVTWCKNYMGRSGLSVDIHDGAPSFSHASHATSSRLWNSNGTQSFQFKETKITTHWDFSSAHFKAGRPEPVSRFHVAVVIDSRIGLLLGDMDEEEAAEKFQVSTPIARFFLVARKQYIFGSNVFSTKACFGDREAHHDVVIRCRRGGEGGDGGKGRMKDPELWVSIDRKKLVHVKRLQWKFRGNAMVLVGGSPVEITWDVHGWLFNPDSGQGIFVFRRRSLLASWPTTTTMTTCGDERSVMKMEEESAGFSTLIYACKSS
ncbi:hypothetical protein ACLOJK_020745 [Asimina triloba]